MGWHVICGAVVRKIVIQEFTHGGLQMRPDFTSEHSFLRGTEGKRNGSKYSVLGT